MGKEYILRDFSQTLRSLLSEMYSRKRFGSWHPEMVEDLGAITASLACLPSGRCVEGAGVLGPSSAATVACGSVQVSTCFPRQEN